MTAAELEEMLDRVAEIEEGATGIRITWKGGDREFVDGGVGLELLKKWKERRTE
jgi:hypothetical protein